MKRKWNTVIGVMICLTLILSLPQSILALTNRPPQTDANGNVIPDPDAFGDAERYGGLFGPLPDPYKDNPLGPILPDFGGYRYPNAILQGWTRNMGFATDQSRFIPINKKESSS